MRKSATDPEQQRRLIAALAAGRGFDQDSLPVEHLQTHISHILLAGSMAYKFKKPLNLGFLDFTDLALRKHYCEEEIRLNRRLAPQLYLDCIAIGGTPDNPRLHATHEQAIEYAVAMRRFDRSLELDVMAGQGRLEQSVVERLAWTLADFHQQAAIDGSGRWGKPESIQGSVEENFVAIRPQLGPGPELELLEALEHWSRTEHARIENVLRTRSAEGRVRECHGDLHLGNIVLIEDQPVVFDCIEFSEALRWIDVMSEIGFLYMDLVYRGRPQLAHVFLDRYLELTGDYQGLSVLPYYLVYRAMVRAKIAAIEETQGSPETNAHVATDLRDHLHLARTLADPAPPFLAITHGLSGSGKSTAADELVRTRGALRLRSDVVRKNLHGIPADGRSSSVTGRGIYTLEATRATYARLRKLALQVLTSGRSVVVDATNLQLWQRETFRNAAEQTGVPFLILDCRAPKTVLRRWVRQRLKAGTDPSEADEAVLEEQIRTQQPFTDDERTNVLRIQTDRCDFRCTLSNTVEARLGRLP